MTFLTWWTRWWAFRWWLLIVIISFDICCYSLIFDHLIIVIGFYICNWLLSIIIIYNTFHFLLPDFSLGNNLNILSYLISPLKPFSSCNSTFTWSIRTHLNFSLLELGWHASCCRPCHCSRGSLLNWWLYTLFLFRNNLMWPWWYLLWWARRIFRWIRYFWAFLLFEWSFS